MFDDRSVALRVYEVVDDILNLNLNVARQGRECFNEEEIKIYQSLVSRLPENISRDDLVELLGTFGSRISEVYTNSVTRRVNESLYGHGIPEAGC